MNDKSAVITLLVCLGLFIGFVVFMFCPKEHFKGNIVEINPGKNYFYALLDGGRIIRIAPVEEGHNVIKGVGDSIEGLIRFSGNVTIQKVFHLDTIKVVK